MKPLQFIILAEGVAARGFPDCATLADVWAWAQGLPACAVTLMPDQDPLYQQDEAVSAKLYTGSQS